MKLSPYVPRPIKFVDVVPFQDWRLKVYAISTPKSQVFPDQIEAGLEPVRHHLSLPIGSLTAANVDWLRLPTYGVGTVIIHQGADAVFTLLDIWIGENMLQHQTWVASIDAPLEFTNITSTGLTTCVWEMAVLQHEREAWLRHVYNPMQAVDFDAYLADTFSATL